MSTILTSIHSIPNLPEFLTLLLVVSLLTFFGLWLAPLLQPTPTRSRSEADLLTLQALPPSTHPLLDPYEGYIPEFWELPDHEIFQLFSPHPNESSYLHTDSEEMTYSDVLPEPSNDFLADLDFPNALLLQVFDVDLTPLVSHTSFRYGHLTACHFLAGDHDYVRKMAAFYGFRSPLQWPSDPSADLQDFHTHFIEQGFDVLLDDDRDLAYDDADGLVDYVLPGSPEDLDLRGDDRLPF